MAKDALQDWNVEKMKEHLDKVGVKWFKTPPTEAPGDDWAPDVTPEGQRMAQRIRAHGYDEAVAMRHAELVGENPLAADLQEYLQSRKVVPMRPEGQAASMARHPAGKALPHTPVIGQ